MTTKKICRLELFDWICVEEEDKKEVFPVCPKHPTSKTRFAPFAGGIIVTCEVGEHRVMLCQQLEFIAELEEARARLDPGM